MIDLINTRSDHVLGVRVEGEITSRDVSLGMSFLEEKIRTRKDIALYLEVDDLSGIEGSTIWTEIRNSASQIKGLRHIKRVAVVTGDGGALTGFAAVDLIPSVDVRFFSTDEREQAKAWADAPAAE